MYQMLQIFILRRFELDNSMKGSLSCYPAVKERYKIHRRRQYLVALENGNYCFTPVIVITLISKLGRQVAVVTRFNNFIVYGRSFKELYSSRTIISIKSTGVRCYVRILRILNLLGFKKNLTSHKYASTVMKLIGFKLKSY